MGQQAWQEARQKDDFPAFRPLLEKMIDLKRQQAEALGYPQCPYDALLDEYEPEELTANVGRVLAGLREELVPLVAEIHAQRPPAERRLLHRTFPVAVQEQFGARRPRPSASISRRGRLDVTAHPFCTDARARTTAASPPATTSISSTRPSSASCTRRATASTSRACRPNTYGLPLGEAISLGIHESQSRLWENLVGRSRAFWQHFYPLAQRRFPAALGDVQLDDFYFAINDVRPSLIRVEADEATYNLHILIRFELEQALLDGDLQAADLPGGLERKISAVSGHRAAGRRRRRVAGRSLERRAGRLFSHLLAGQSLRGPVLRPGRGRLGRSERLVCPRRFPSAARLAARRSTVMGSAIRPRNWSSG